MKNNGEKNILVTLFKIVMFVGLVVLQLLFFNYIYSYAKDVYIYANSLFELFRVVAVLYIIYKHDNPAFKISWLIFIMITPVIGLILYFSFGNAKLPKKIKLKGDKISINSFDLLTDDKTVLDEIKKEDKRIYNCVNYIGNVSNYPVYKNSSVEYLSVGEEYFKNMISDMKKAKKYIFMEYFIIADGKILSEIMDVLKERSSCGVEVFIMCDGIGSMFTLPKGFKKMCVENNIKFRIFNKVTAKLTAYLNNRDHRKITVIDGVVAYTGGINIGDEYANVVSKYGHWKDSGIKIEGEAVWSYAVMFLRMWNLYEKNEVEYLNYKVETTSSKEDGYVMPFCDGPYDLMNTGEDVYLNVINTAKDYVYITSPYLIIGNELLTALCNAAKSGVDVRIMVPGVPDKKIVYTATRSFYDELLKAGVKIYEYTPGFIHSKTYVCDDDVSIVGSINMDFRSLYLLYEVGTYFYKSSISKVMRDDFIKMVGVSKEVKYNYWKKRHLFTRVSEAILRALSPLL